MTVWTLITMVCYITCQFILMGNCNNTLSKVGFTAFATLFVVAFMFAIDNEKKFKNRLEMLESKTKNEEER